MSDEELSSLPDPGSPGSNPAATSLGRPGRRIGWWIHLVLIGGYFFPSIFLGRVRIHPALTYQSGGLLTVCAIQFGIFAIVFGLGWLASGANRQEMLLNWRPGWLVFPLGFGYSVAIRLGIGIIAVMVSGILLATVLNQRQLEDFWRAGEPNIRQIVSVSAARSDPVYAWLLITVVSFVVAGLREELWRAGTLAAMRGLWPRAFGSRPGEIVAILLIAIEFGAGHFRLGLVPATFAGILGIFLGLIMLAHRSVWPAVIAHGFFDATSFALLAWLPASFQHFK